jgi:DNA-binding response OmpR family regulator
MTPPLILLIDDEPLILMDLEAQLVDAGFEVVTASDGAEGLATFKDRADDLRVVVTDIRLGNGPNGWDVGREMRAAVPTMPIIYVSGDSAAEWASRGVPGSVMIGKPFAIVQLTTAIAQLLNQADATVAQPHPSVPETPQSE